MRRFAIIVTGFLLALAAAKGTEQPGSAEARPGAGAENPIVAGQREIERDPTALGVPFERYTTRDKLKRKIMFYISVANPSQKQLPLIVFVQGSGCMSHFIKRGERVYGGWQNLLLELAKGRARILVVEKPGVNYLDASQRPGSAEGASKEFLEEHTLSRWVEAVSAAIRAAQSLPEIDRGRTLVVGHSEGGIVAAHVASENPAITHVACLSSSGPTQLFDLVEVARALRAPDEPEQARNERADRVYEEWAQIQADPDSITHFYQGHPYRRWSSFLRASTLDGLLRSRACIYVAHGTDDKSVPVASFDVLRAELAARGCAATTERIEGADHRFRKPGETETEGMRNVLGRVLQWFFGA